MSKSKVKATIEIRRTITKRLDLDVNGMEHAKVRVEEIMAAIKNSDFNSIVEETVTITIAGQPPVTLNLTPKA
jgi:hypothetical protein